MLPRLQTFGRWNWGAAVVNRPNWRTVAELIGMIALVASLVFVGLQIQQEQEIAESQA